MSCISTAVCPNYSSKDAAAKGAVLLCRNGAAKRVRRANAELHDGDLIELHNDSAILALQPPPAGLTCPSAPVQTRAMIRYSIKTCPHTAPRAVWLRRIGLRRNGPVGDRDR